MRQRGEFLLMIEADQCSRFVATTGAAGAGGATVEEIVAGLRSYQVAGSGGGVMSSGVTSSGVTSSGRPSAGPAPSSPSAPPAAARGGRPY
jgi:hypothetical protein